MENFGYQSGVVDYSSRQKNVQMDFYNTLKNDSTKIFNEKLSLKNDNEKKREIQLAMDKRENKRQEFCRYLDVLLPTFKKRYVEGVVKLYEDIKLEDAESIFDLLLDCSINKAPFKEIKDYNFLLFVKDYFPFQLEAKAVKSALSLSTYSETFLNCKVFSPEEFIRICEENVCNNY